MRDWVAKRSQSSKKPVALRLLNHRDCSWRIRRVVAPGQVRCYLRAWPCMARWMLLDAGDKQAAAVVGVRASHQIGGAGHRTIPALCVAVPDLLPGDALVMDQSLHWQLTRCKGTSLEKASAAEAVVCSTGVPNNDDNDPPKMLLFEFTAAENSTDR